MILIFTFIYFRGCVGDPVWRSEDDLQGVGSPSIMWVSGIKFRSLALVASALPIDPSHQAPFQVLSNNVSQQLPSRVAGGSTKRTKRRLPAESC